MAEIYTTSLSVSSRLGKELKLNLDSDYDDSFHDNTAYVLYQETDLVAFYKLDSDATDSKGDYDGTEGGNITYTTGINGQSAVFSGAEYIRLPGGTTLIPATKFGISAWFYPTNIDAESNVADRIITFHRGVVGSGSGFYIGVWNDAGTKKVIVRWYPFGPDDFLETEITENEWHHAYTEYDGAKVYFFVDGTYVGYKYQIEVTIGSYPAYIGAYSTAQDFFEGRIDEVRILTDSRGNGAKHAEEYYNNGNGHDGSILGFDTGKVDNASLFDGAGKYLKVDSYQHPSDSQVLTAAMWVKKDVIYNFGSLYTFISDARQSSSDDSQGYYWWRMSSLGSVDLNYADGATQYGPVSYFGSVLTDEEWHHIILVFDWGNAKARVYKDSVLVDENDLTTPQAPTFPNPLYIGGYSSYWHKFQGSIDDVRVYSRYLTQTEIDALYNEGSGTAEEILTAVNIPTSLSLSTEEYAAALSTNEYTTNLEVS